MNRIFLIVLSWILSFSGIAQTLFINEIIASNKTGVMDDFFQRDDWIEIYNAGNLINLAGYYLSDDPTDLTKWLVPSTNLGATYILPNDYLIFWADKDLQQGETHTNFSLNVDGEFLFLVAPDGTTIIDSVAFPQLVSDISYGRVSDGSDEWTFFNTPTFKAANMISPQATDILFINEVQTNNISTYHDQNFAYSRWVEIYNPNSYQVNLAGYTFDVGNGQTWTLPNTNPYWTAIAANQFITVWFDQTQSIETNHLPLSLAENGGTIILKGPDGSVVDQLSYLSIPENKSYGRQSDGSPNWIIFSIPTPKVSNSTVYIQPAPVVINEVISQNQSAIQDNFGQFDDWFEIYNPTGHPVNLAGYYVSDKLGNPVKWRIPDTFPDSVTVPAHGWLLFWADEDQQQGVRHTNFKLNNSAECLSLYSPDGFTQVDAICWSALYADSSYGRINDGVDPWWLFTTSTPNASNNTGILNTVSPAPKPLIVYPNPATDLIYCRKESTFEVYGIDGRWMGHYSNITELNISAWPAGMYFVADDTGNVQKLVKN